MATKTLHLPGLTNLKTRDSHLEPQFPRRVFRLLSSFQVGTRTVYRAVLLLQSLFAGVMRFAWIKLQAGANRTSVTPQQRAEWMHFCGVTVLTAIGIRYRVEGTLPQGTTLIVANHLSYLDIAVFSAALPCAFVAKQEIASWPGFGSLARVGGAIFVDRERRMSAWDTMSCMQARLSHRVPVLVFPEGTSTDGSSVERFNATLLEAAIQSQVPITPASVSYEPGCIQIIEKDLCWFGDELFIPHLKRVLGVKTFTAVIRFGESEYHPDRKAAAWRTHEAIESMRHTTP